MEGYYDKVQTSSILGVSARQIQNYIKDGRLRRIYQGKKLWIPKSDVTALHEQISSGIRPGREEIHDMATRLKRLEEEVEVLKLGLGFGARGKPRKKVELLMMRQTILDALAKGRWTNREISEAATLVAQIQEEELINLYDEVGAAAWAPIMDLMKAMLRHVENQPEYPGAGLQTLQQRIIQAREKFLGLVYATTHTATRPIALKAAQVYHTLKIPLGALDQYILSVILEGGTVRHPKK